MGTCVILATQAGTTNIQPAPAVDQRLVVSSGDAGSAEPDDRDTSSAAGPAAGQDGSGAFDDSMDRSAQAVAAIRWLGPSSGNESDAVASAVRTGPDDQPALPWVLGITSVGAGLLFAARKRRPWSLDRPA